MENTTARRIGIAGLAAFIALGAAACTPAEHTPAGAQRSAAVPTPSAAATPSGSAESPSVESPPPPSAQADAKPATDRDDITIASHGTSRLRFGPWTSKPARSLPGALYLRNLRGKEMRVQFSILANGHLRSTTLQGKMTEYDCSSESAVISPDGRFATWVEGDAGTGKGGNLVVAPFAMSGVTYGTIVATGIQCSGEGHPNWMADSRRLLVSKRTGQTGIIDVRSGSFTPKRHSWHEYRAFSRPDGAFMAHASDGTIVVETAAGKVLRQVPFSLGERSAGSFAVQAISADGRYVGVGPHNTDPQTFWGAPWIVDTVAGKEIPLPVKVPAGGVSVSVRFLASGGMLQTTSTKRGAMTLHLLNAARTLVASIPLEGSAFVNAYVAY